MTPFLKTTLIVSLSFILHTCAMASAEGEDSKLQPRPWPVYLGDVRVNGILFTQEEIAAAQEGKRPARKIHLDGANAMVLTMHGKCITVGAFDLGAHPFWWAVMKKRREAKEADAWYQGGLGMWHDIVMENTTDEGFVERLTFKRFRVPHVPDNRAVAGYLTQDISSTRTSQLVVQGVDHLEITFRLPPPASWIWPNFSHMRFGGQPCHLKARTGGLAEPKDSNIVMTLSAGTSKNLFFKIVGQDIHCSTPDATFCEEWRKDIWRQVSAQTPEPQESFDNGAFFYHDGVYFGGAHKNDAGKSLEHMTFGCKYESLSPIKRICLQRAMPDLEGTPLRVSGFLDFETLTTKGLLVEGLSTLALSLGRAVSLADTLD